MSVVEKEEELLNLTSLIAHFFIMLSGAAELSPHQRAVTPVRAEEIIYVSSDLSRVAVFGKDHARFGSALALSGIGWPSSPARYLEIEENIQCVSVGPAFSSIEFAIKRPIKEGEKYRCLKTSFHVVKCFAGCRAAIVERRFPLGGSMSRVFRKSYLYVDDCLGVSAFSESSNLQKGIPHDAEWLRGSVGILADKAFPGCSRFG